MKIMVKINKMEYDKLLSHIDEVEFEPLSFDSRFKVNPVINSYIEENQLLEGLVARDLGWSLLEDKFVGYPIMDHELFINFNEKLNGDYYQGIVSFTYKDLDVFKELNSQYWSFYVVNPLLFNYNEDTVGIMMVPSSYHDFSIDIADVSYFIQGLTGYHLFYEYTSDDVEPIVESFPDVSKDAFYKLITEDCDRKAFKILFDFWFENDEIYDRSFDYIYNNFKKNISFSYSMSLLRNFKSNAPFRLVFDDGEVFDGLYELSMGLFINSVETVSTDSSNAGELLAEHKLTWNDFRQGWLYIKTSPSQERKEDISLSYVNSVQLMLGMFKLEMEA